MNMLANLLAIAVSILALLVVVFVTSLFPHSLGIANLYQKANGYLSTFFSWFPYWGPFVLGYIFWHEWIHYIQARFRANMKWVLLEVKVPKEVFKSPAAMEVMLNALYQSSTGSWWDKYWKGKVKDWFSLEMVSIDGQIKFFIRTVMTYKNIIEAQLYGQYPDVEIYEVPDYTRYVDYRGAEGDWAMIGLEFKLSKPDPYPIKTYIDYGLDKDPKEEFKIDPLTSVVEYLGSIGKGEQLWIQIIAQAASKRYHKHDGGMGDWKDEAKDIIKELSGRDKKEEDDKFQMMKLTKGEQETISAIERSVGKLGFDVGIRALYLAKKDKLDMRNTKALGGLLRVFSSNNLNGFELYSPDHQTFGWDFPWQDYKDMRMNVRRKEQFEAYKTREWFHTPRKLKPFVLTTEELATIYHFPGGVAQTPTFGRITSRKSEAPVNLPI